MELLSSSVQLVVDNTVLYDMVNDPKEWINAVADKPKAVRKLIEFVPKGWAGITTN